MWFYVSFPPHKQHEIFFPDSIFISSQKNSYSCSFFYMKKYDDDGNTIHGSKKKCIKGNKEMQKRNEKDYICEQEGKIIL